MITEGSLRYELAGVRAFQTSDKYSRNENKGKWTKCNAGGIT